MTLTSRHKAAEMLLNISLHLPHPVCLLFSEEEKLKKKWNSWCQGGVQSSVFISLSVSPLHQNYEAIMWKGKMNISELIYLQYIEIKFCSPHPDRHDCWI